MKEDWRRRYWYQALIILEAVLSAVMLIVGYIRGSGYFRGVGVGLLIAWITGTIAYLYVMRAPTKKA
jgi:hypothetical protein